jgi:hypothetical protein
MFVYARLVMKNQLILILAGCLLYSTGMGSGLLRAVQEPTFNLKSAY